MIYEQRLLFTWKLPLTAHGDLQDRIVDVREHFFMSKRIAKSFVMLLNDIPDSCIANWILFAHDVRVHSMVPIVI